MKNKNKVKQMIITGIFVITMFGGAFVKVNSQSNNSKESASGEGKLINPDGSRSRFSFAAKRNQNGKVSGKANLRNPSFRAGDGEEEVLKIEITCLRVVGKTAIFGGETKRKNNLTQTEAWYFAVEDSGNKNEADKIFRGFFFDDDPTTKGEPDLCHTIEREILVFEPIADGEIEVKK